MSVLMPALMNDVPPYCWLLESDVRKLGVHRESGWCAQFADRCVFFESEPSCVHLLPVLELDGNDFFALLSRSEILFPEYANSIRKFPKLLLIQHAFRHYSSDYWPGKAMTWLERDPGLQPLLVAELDEISGNKANSQQLRQRAKRMLRGLTTVAA